MTQNHLTDKQTLEEFESNNVPVWLELRLYGIISVSIPPVFLVTAVALSIPSSNSEETGAIIGSLLGYIILVSCAWVVGKRLLGERRMAEIAGATIVEATDLQTIHGNWERRIFMASVLITSVCAFILAKYAGSSTSVEWLGGLGGVTSFVGVSWMNMKREIRAQERARKVTFYYVSNGGLLSVLKSRVIGVKSTYGRT